MERKIRLGYLDEDYLHRSSFYQHFKDNFEVITWDNFEEIRTLEQLRKEIDEQEIEVLAVDYKLAENEMYAIMGMKLYKCCIIANAIFLYLWLLLI